MGVFPAGAPATVRAVSGQAEGQISVEQMIDRYQIACRPVRDLLVDYLRERQIVVDYVSLRELAFGLGKLFWKDLVEVCCNRSPRITALACYHLASS